MILDGAPHGAVYSFLERRHNEMQQEGLGYHRFPGGEGDAEADFEIETSPDATEGDGVSFDEPEP